MTIEKEAEDCVYPENNPMDAFWKSICDEHPCIGEELESIRFRITKALQKKQDRIEELESALKEMIEACNVAYTPALVQSYGWKPLLKAFKRAKKAIGGGK